MKPDPLQHEATDVRITPVTGADPEKKPDRVPTINPKMAIYIYIYSCFREVFRSVSEAIGFIEGDNFIFITRSQIDQLLT